MLTKKIKEIAMAFIDTIKNILAGINVINFGAAVRSKPVRNNYEIHDNAIETIAARIDALEAAIGNPNTDAEVIVAREQEVSLVDNLRNIKSSLATYQYQVFGGSSLKVSESSPAAMTVDVAAGSAVVNGINATYAGGTSGAISAAAAGKHRYDSVVVNTAGSVIVKTGAEVATTDTRARPTILASEKELAYIDIDESTSSITDALITDTRTIYARGVPFVTVGDFGMFDTIQQAIDYIVDTQGGNGLIYLAAGDYTESLDFTGVQKISVTISGDTTINTIPYLGGITLTSAGIGAAEFGNNTTGGTDKIFAVGCGYFYGGAGNDDDALVIYDSGAWQTKLSKLVCGSVHSASGISEAILYNALHANIYGIGDKIMLNGSASDSANVVFTPSYAERVSSSEIRIYGGSATNGGSFTTTFHSVSVGGTSNLFSNGVSISW